MIQILSAPIANHPETISLGFRVAFVLLLFVVLLITGERKTKRSEKENHEKKRIAQN
jgi:hypothetical protein